MIPRTDDWKNALANAVRDPAELLALLALPHDLLPAARRAAASFPLRVPRGFVARMGRADAADPLLRQVLPLDAELAPVPGFVADPVGDGAARSGPGMLQKYAGRALLVVTGACAVHCRYCFRRHFPYAEENAARAGWTASLAALAARTDLAEVILSGGDPLAIDDERLADLIQGLAALPHLTRLRIHTRLPVVLPERITDRLLALLSGTRLQPVMVVHANHPNELGGDVDEAFGRLRRAGITLFNQAVLLRGINDDADTLAALHERLFAAGVMPYYLHLLDRVAGAAHFEVPATEAAALLEVLRRRLPGYLVPRLVREQEGAPYKIPILSL